MKEYDYNITIFEEFTDLEGQTGGQVLSMQVTNEQLEMIVDMAFDNGYQVVISRIEKRPIDGRE